MRGLRGKAQGVHASVGGTDWSEREGGHERGADRWADGGKMGRKAGYGKGVGCFSFSFLF